MNRPEKDDGTLKSRCEVEGRVRVALAAGALTEVTNDTAAVAGALHGIGGTHG